MAMAGSRRFTLLSLLALLLAIEGVAAAAVDEEASHNLNLAPHRRQLLRGVHRDRFARSDDVAAARLKLLQDEEEGEEDGHEEGEEDGHEEGEEDGHEEGEEDGHEEEDGREEGEEDGHEEEEGEEHTHEEEEGEEHTHEEEEGEEHTHEEEEGEEHSSHEEGEEHSSHEGEDAHADDDHNDLASVPASAWGEAILATAVLSLVSVVGVLLLFIPHFNIRQWSMELVGLSIGTLLGASFFLLIPETAEIVGLGLEGSGCILAGIMASYIIETALSFRKNYHGHAHGGGLPQDAQDADDAVNAVHKDEPSSLEMGELEDGSRITKRKSVATSSSTSDISRRNSSSNSSRSSKSASEKASEEGEEKATPTDDPEDESVEARTEGATRESSYTVSSEKSRDDSEREIMKDANVPSDDGEVAKKSIPLSQLPGFVLVNLIGDALHNFVDGALIGATFATGTAEGIATTLAIAAHELPAEVADFGILVHAGLSVKMALFLNFIVSAVSILGAIFALGIGQTFVGSTDYMLPFAVGIFIYLALADLVPEALHVKNRARKARVNIMLLVGMGAMALLLLLPHDHAHGVGEDGHEDHDHE